MPKPLTKEQKRVIRITIMLFIMFALLGVATGTIYNITNGETDIDKAAEMLFGDKRVDIVADDVDLADESEPVE